jgi:hypothetical protein
MSRADCWQALVTECEPIDTERKPDRFLIIHEPWLRARIYLTHIWSAPHCKGKIIVCMKEKLQSYIRHLVEELYVLVP